MSNIKLADKIEWDPSFGNGELVVDGLRINANALFWFVQHPSDKWSRPYWFKRDGGHLLMTTIDPNTDETVIS